MNPLDLHGDQHDSILVGQQEQDDGEPPASFPQLASSCLTGHRGRVKGIGMIGLGRRITHVSQHIIGTGRFTTGSTLIFSPRLFFGIYRTPPVLSDRW